MKNKKFEKKLHLNKRTITNLGQNDQEWVKGGGPVLTEDPTICVTCTCECTFTCTCVCTNPETECLCSYPLHCGY